MTVDGILENARGEVVATEGANQSASCNKKRLVEEIRDGIGKAGYGVEAVQCIVCA